MDYNTLSQAIGSLGFPIVCACGFFWMLNTTMKEFTVTINNLNQSIISLTHRIRGVDEE